MNEINFTKLTGAGNDFILIDKKLNQGISIDSNLIRKICDRRFGVGADGILTIDDDENTDFKMEYFNSDGSSGMLCGNGARCIIKYADYSGRIDGTNTNFTFGGENFSGVLVDDEIVTFRLNSPTKLKQNFEIEILNKQLNVSFIDTGAHHVIVNVDDQINAFDNLEEFLVEKFGREIRYSKYFSPIGTNVNFISIKDKTINIRTYERGVEEETLACGTGAVASAITSVIDGKIETPVKVKTRGGDILEVDFTINEKMIDNVSLTGPAKIVFQGKYKIDNEEN